MTTEVKGLGPKAYLPTDFLSQEEASEFLGLNPRNRNSLYWWKRRIAPNVPFPKQGKQTRWPAFFLQEIINQRLENLQNRRKPK